MERQNTIVPSESSYENHLQNREEFLRQLPVGLQRKVSPIKFPNSVFWVKNGKAIFQYDKLDGDFWCCYETVWQPLELLFNIDPFTRYKSPAIIGQFLCEINCIPNAIREMVANNFDVFDIKQPYFVIDNIATGSGIRPQCFNTGARVGIEKIYWKVSAERTVEWKQPCLEPVEAYLQ